MPSDDSSPHDPCQMCAHPRGMHVPFGPERTLLCLYCTSQECTHAFELATPERVREFLEEHRRVEEVLAARTRGQHEGEPLTITPCPKGELCTHEDGDGFAPASSVQAWAGDRGLGEWFSDPSACPRPALIEGWQWASRTLYVHLGPLSASPEGWRSLTVTREVKPA